MDLDLLLSAVSGVIQALIVYWGYKLTVDPVETPRQRRIYKALFIGAGIVGVSIIVIQQKMNRSEQSALRAELEAIRTGVRKVEEQTKQPPQVNLTIPPPLVLPSPPVEVGPSKCVNSVKFTSERRLTTDGYWTDIRIPTINENTVVLKVLYEGPEPFVVKEYKSPYSNAGEVDRRIASCGVTPDFVSCGLRGLVNGQPAIAFSLVSEKGPTQVVCIDRIMP